MKRYTAKSLVATYHYLKAHPAESYLFGDFPGDSMNFAQWRVWFVSCLNEKINRLDVRRGKKDTPEYRQALARDVMIIRERVTTRIGRTGRNLLTTPEAKRRYPHIDNCSLD